MKALILNGERLNEDLLDVLSQEVANESEALGWEAEAIVLRDVKIGKCLGCFCCWTKTPGRCVIDDFGRDLALKVVNSDVLVLLSPVTFGGYSSELKKAIDRFANSMLLPFFMKIGGEVHHKPRYAHMPVLVAIGILPAPEKESELVFKKLVERNAINFHSPVSRSAVFYISQTAEQIGDGVSSLLRGLEQ